MEFYITGGCIKIQKSDLVREMLVKDSLLRTLLRWKSSSDLSGSHPGIGEPDEQGIVTIDFSHISKVSLGETPEELLKQLKARYKDKVRGRIACRASLYTFEIDLGSDGDGISFLMG